MIKKTNLIILCVVILYSCKKNSSNQALNVSAKIVDQGNPAADGCGWHIVTDSGIDYMPKNLDSAFHVDSLPVIISFIPEGKDACGLLPAEFPAIRLTTIKKR